MALPDPGTWVAPGVDELFQGAPCGLVSTGADGTIMVVNDEFVRLSGCSRMELVEQVRFQDLLSAGGRILHETHVAPMLRLQGFVREMALELVRADATRLPVVVSFAQRDAPDHGAPRVQMVVFDATERRGYEEELLVASRRIERLQRITERFAGALDTRQVAGAAVDEIVDHVKADVGALSLLAVGRPGVLTSIDVRAETSEAVEAWTKVSTASIAPLDAALSGMAPAFLEGNDGTADGIPSLTARDAPCRRLAILPLVVDGRSIGLLCLGSRTHATFADDERTFLQAFARACAQALDRARLHELTAVTAARMAFLSALSQALDEPISVTDRAQAVVELLVPHYADFASIEIPERGPAPVAAQHVDPALLGPLIDLRTKARLAADRPHSLAQGRQTLGPQLLPHIPEALYDQYELPEDQLDLLRRLGPRSYVGLPLVARGHTIGSLMVVMSASGRHFSEDDLSFLTDIAERSALALENARLYEQEQALAYRLQMSFLPRAFPTDSRVHIDARYRPSTASLQIGGDWYDAFMLGPSRLGFAVGDVVGHNEEAALVMGQLSTALRAFAVEGGGPAATIARLSRFVDTVPGASCTTVAYAELDLDTRVLTYACAGHPPPIVLHAGQPALPAWRGRSPALGAIPDAVPTESSMTLRPRATVVLFTDGLVERRGVPFDDSLADLLSRLNAHAASEGTPFSATFMEALVEAAPPDDDLCLLAVTLTPPTRS